MSSAAKHVVVCISPLFGSCPDTLDTNWDTETQFGQHIHMLLYMCKITLVYKHNGLEGYVS